MTTQYETVPINFPAAETADLVSDARAAGFRFVDRLTREWETGENRFDRQGEKFLGVSLHRTLVGMGGLNIDPYAKDPGIGRIRHLYVLSTRRRSGIGSLLLTRLLDGAEQHFKRIRLRTAETTPDAFYTAHGFRPSDEVNASHELILVHDC
ncbi:MAG: GNAT family N-acetyltransferase [Hyphomicrobiaceae bacterium]